MLIIPPIRIYRKVVGKLQQAYILLFRRSERVYAGVDYAKILDSAEKEADIILWDGDNNDWPFFKSNLEIVLL